MALDGDIPAFQSVRQAPGTFCGQPRASAVFRPTAMVAKRRGTSLLEVPLSTAKRNDLIVLGAFVGTGTFTASSTADGSGGALDANSNAQSITVRVGVLGRYGTGSTINAVTDADVGEICFAYDDNTVYRTDLGGDLSPAGVVVEVDEDGLVYVDHNALRVGQASAQQATFRARGVVYANVADLAAFTVAETLESITYEVGDIVLLAAQTTASQCGLYRVGPVAAGVAALTRIRELSTGIITPPGLTVEIGSEGTYYKNSTWKALTTGAVIGTTDPLFYPKTYKQTVTLASGTYTIGLGSTATPDEPLFLRTGSTIQCSRNTVGGTVTATIEYAAPGGTRTAGKAGAAVAVILAVIDAGTINAADNSTVDVTVTNW